MKTKFTKKYLHLTLDDRIEIQECLAKGMSFKAIGKHIGKDRTTVSKEIKKHMVVSPAKIKRTDKDGVVVLAVCPKLLKPPFVCNSCPRVQTSCAYDRHIYRAKQAYKEYEGTLSSSREGIPLTKQKFFNNDRIISEAVKNGQHLYHVLKSNNLDVSISTAYRHFKKGYYSACSLDLPRAVKFKPRAGKPVEYVPKALKIGRTYDDFNAYINENDISSWVEMDTLIGRVGGKAILTFNFVPFNFMFGLLLENKIALETASKIKELKQRLVDNDKSFKDFFSLLLTDNGGEFADIFSIENDLDGNPETKLYFCDPYQSCQKARIEKTHTMFRDIVEKGKSFDSFTQEHVNIIFSHINSVKRKSLNGKTPLDIFNFLFGDGTASLFGITKIAAEAVVQSSKLLKAIGLNI